MNPLAQENVPAALFNVPYDQKWDLLKLVIERLYIEEAWKLSQVVRMIQDWCGFNAA